jgi:hypothetical protein
MTLPQEYYSNLIHLGAILYLVCFLFRNQIHLRLFAIMGDLVYTAYYFGVASHPLWEAMVWSVLNMGVNAVMIAMIINDNRETKLGDNELRLYRNLASLSPGEFRKLMALGKWHTATENIVLTNEGQSLDQLYYVLEGEVDIEKSGRKIEVKPELFIGEIAYLLRKPASATVAIKKGALYVAWSHTALEKAITKQDALKNALNTLLSADLATKVARS